MIHTNYRKKMESKSVNMANLFRESRMSLVLGPFFLAECFMNEAQLYKFPVQQRPKCGALNHPDMNPWESSFQIDHRTLVETYLKPPSSSGLIHLNHNIEQNIPQKKGGCLTLGHSVKYLHTAPRPVTWGTSLDHLNHYCLTKNNIT